MANWDDTPRPTPLAKFREFQELAQKYSHPLGNHIHVEEEAAADIEALFRAMERDDLEAAAIHRKAAFDKLAAVRGPEWAEWASSILFKDKTK